MWTRLRNKLSFWYRGRRFEVDLAEELEFHRSMLQSHIQHSGTTREDAVARADRRMGNLTLAHEEARDAWVIRWLDVLLQDLRYSLRMFARSPAFTAVALLTLALGIGANAALFRLVDTVMLRQLPVDRPAELLVLRSLFAHPRFEQLRNRQEVFSGVFASHTLRDAELGADVRSGGSGSTSTAPTGLAPLGLGVVELVSGNYFSLLGVRPVLGRAFTADDDRVPEGSAVAVISHGLWKRAFQMAPDVVGRTLRVRGGALGGAGTSGFEQSVPDGPRADGAALTIIGVAPPEFFGDTVGTAVDVWTPIMMQPALMPGRAWLARTTARWLNVMGRLKPGVSQAQAQASLTTLTRQLATDEAGQALSDQQKQNIARSTMNVESGEKGFTQLRREFSQPLLILMSVVALVLLIACLNIANLLLARATARHHEISMRLSLGASRARLIAQLLTESLLLSILGGALGLLIAAFGTRVLVNMVTSENRPIALSFALDWRIVAFTAGVSLLSGVVFGLAPAWRGTGVGLQTALKDSGRTTTSGKRRIVRVLVAAQVGVSLVLLVGAGLFLRTLYNLQTQHVGYDRDGLVLLRVDPVGAGYRGEAIGRACVELMQRLAAIPGLRAVTFSENGLFSGTESGTHVAPEGFNATRDEDRMARFDQIGPYYFTRLGIPVLAGRELDERDRPGAPRATVINETMARFHYPNASPIGKRLRARLSSTESVDLEVVGVVRDAQDHNLRWEPVRRFYVSYLHPIDGLTGVKFELRATNTGAIMPAIRDEVRRFDPTLQIQSLKSVQALIDESIVSERLVARLSSFFGALALILAAIGLYGVMSYAVSLRTSEIGIRMALGARQSTVARMILAEIVLIVLCGAAAGAAAAFGLSRYVSSLVFGLTANDPLTFAAAAVVLLLVGLAAGYLPARRAARIDPLIALRYE